MSIQVIHWETAPGPVEFKIPANMSATYRIIGGHIHLLTSATGGNRRLRLGTYDESDHTIQESHSVNQSSSLDRHYNLIDGTNRETTVTDDEIEIGIPSRWFLLPNWTLRIYDSNAIDVVNDDYTVHMVVERLASSDRRI